MTDFTPGTWYPIETVPRDGTKIDVWVVTTSAENGAVLFTGRETDVFWKDGKWLRLVREDDFCGDEVEIEGTSWCIEKITHWTPRPGMP